MAIRLWVDDFLSISNSTEFRDSIFNSLNSKFKILDLGKTKKLLGMEVFSILKSVKTWISFTLCKSNLFKFVINKFEPVSVGLF